jgi:hypothetical protein
MRTAIVFLANKPHENTIDFAIEVKRQTNFDTFVVIDDNTQYHGKSFKEVNLIQIPDKLCEESGYSHSVFIENATQVTKNPIAWDKFLYSFCELDNTSYDFVMVFEDDVFIQSIQSIVDFHEKYNKFDLITPNNFKKQDNLLDWHWRSIMGWAYAPYYYSMVSAMALSRNTLNLIKEHAKLNGRLFFHEAMFNTLAMQNQLKVTDALELTSIVWQGKWDLDEFLLLPNNFFHPRKDIENHPKLRQQISKAIKDVYVPKNNLPQFIKDKF